MRIFISRIGDAWPAILARFSCHIWCKPVAVPKVINVIVSHNTDLFTKISCYNIP